MCLLICSKHGCMCLQLVITYHRSAFYYIFDPINVLQTLNFWTAYLLSITANLLFIDLYSNIVVLSSFIPLLISLELMINTSFFNLVVFEWVYWKVRREFVRVFAPYSLLSQLIPSHLVGTENTLCRIHAPRHSPVKTVLTICHNPRDKDGTTFSTSLSVWVYICVLNALLAPVVRWAHSQRQVFQYLMPWWGFVCQCNVDCLTWYVLEACQVYSYLHWLTYIETIPKLETAINVPYFRLVEIEIDYFQIPHSLLIVDSSALAPLV